MILYEYEGKKLLAQSAIKLPKSQLIDSEDFTLSLNLPVVIKAQVLSGNRAKEGGIKFAESEEQLRQGVEEMLGSHINGERVEKILIEEKIEIKNEFYLSISYDTENRGMVLNFSEDGGSGIEERTTTKTQIDILNPQTKVPQLEGEFDVDALVELFLDSDATLMEINPLAKDMEGNLVALDAKVKLDDAAQGRHKDWDFAPRSAPGHTTTKREIEAKKIDQDDYRGVAGSAFFDLPGNIAVMASGGGASLFALDTLIRQGGKPANYTEYGGNPPKEKVLKLTTIVLDKNNLSGLWVVGALANFTDIYQTLLGFIEGLREAEKLLGRKIDFPIVIRRAGPNDEKAKEMIKDVTDFDIHLYGEEISISQSAQIMIQLANEYEQTTR